MQWMMLQQDKPEDFVIATGVQYSVREFINKAATALGMTLSWSGTGVDEVAYCHSRADGNPCPADPIVRIDTRYYRPTEVETLLGDPTKAKEKLGWTPEITLDEMVTEMVASDLGAAKRQVLLKTHGYKVSIGLEN
jgi:GDPmannose 4,6-dehydratase